MCEMNCKSWRDAMMQPTIPGQRTTRTFSGVAAGRGFTLIELLVVIAIIALLIGILLPALARARDSARTMTSLANQRNLVTLLTTYADDYRGKFPPNHYQQDPVDGKQGRRWFDVVVLGDYLDSLDGGDLGFSQSATSLERPTVGGGVMVNPNHVLGGRSYSMNYWASSYVWVVRTSFTVANQFRAVAPGVAEARTNRDDGFGRGFDINVDEASSMILIADGWGEYFKDESGNGEARGFTGETLGSRSLPGQRFGSNPSLQLRGVFEFPNTQNANNPEFISGQRPSSYIPYYRHPLRTTDIYDVKGRAQFGFVDGSARPFDSQSLFDDATDDSSYQVLWSPIDRQVEDE